MLQLVPVFKHREATEMGEQMVQVFGLNWGPAIDRNVCVQADFQDAQALLQSVFLPGVPFLRVVVVSSWLYSSSSAIATSSEYSSTSSSSLWQFIESGQEFPSHSWPNFQIHNFCKFSGFIVFLYYYFSPFDKIQILYNRIIHVLSLLSLSADCWD